jgi:hypothetical protein
MNAEDFKRQILNNADFDYGLCPPPIKAQDGLNILIKHFLGDNWYVTLPINQEQVNAEAIYDILKKYPIKRRTK